MIMIMMIGDYRRDLEGGGWRKAAGSAAPRSQPHARITITIIANI